MKKTLKINLWEIWDKNFHLAKRFFESNGNMKTRSRLKDVWYKSFQKDLEKAIEEVKRY